MNAIHWLIHGVAAAALVTAGTPAGAEGTLDAETLKRYGGTYSSDCSNPTAARATVFAEALVVVQGNKRVAGGNVQAAWSFFGQSPPPNHELVLMSELPGGARLLFIVYRDKAGQYLTLDGDRPVQDALGKALLGKRLRHCDGAGRPSAAAPAEKSAPAAPTGAPSEAQVDAGGLLMDRRFKAAYYKALGPLVREFWLVRLDGPSPPAKKVMVAGTEYLLASSCKNHDCGDNNIVLLYSAARGVVYGKVFRRGKSTLIGAPPPAVAGELERLWASEWRQNR